MAAARLTGPAGGPLAREALAIARAGLRAVDPGRLVRRELARRPYPATALLALGKAALAMARVVAPVGRPALLVRPRPAGRAAGAPDGWEECLGGHPLPDAGSLACGERVHAFVAGLGATDRLLVLLSGGASACVERLAAGLVLDDLIAANRALLAADLSIGAVNAVRRHLSTIKGGGLLRATPARVLVLLLSDVPGDAPETIGSGPFAADPTTYREALEVAVRARLPAAMVAHLAAGARGEREETLSPDDPALARVEHRLLASVAAAGEGASRAASRRGFHVARAALTGEAGQAAAALLAVGRALTGVRVALVASGETTVELGPRPGRGGRNQHLALTAARELAGCGAEVLLALATDGIDGTSDAAGALVDGSTWERAAAAGHDPARALAEHDSWSALAAGGALLGGGPTGTNAADLVLYLRDAGSERVRYDDSTAEESRS